MATDIRDAIAQKFLDALNAGIIPWRKPWAGGSARPRNAITQKPYRGVNALYLGLLATVKGYPTGEWLTLNQCKKAGGRVQGSEWKNGTAVVFWKFMKREKLVNGKMVEETFPLCRSFTVFNRAQCEGLPAGKEIVYNNHTIEDAQRIVDGMPNAPKLNITESDSAHYMPSFDTVTLPKLSQFVNAESFYATAFHELAHATGHKTRLNREGVMEGKGFGSDSYSKEELVAEMTAAFLSAECGILDKVEQNSTAYVQHWAAKLNSEPRMIIEAAGAAQKAADYILGTTFQKDDED
jgi:antirestriction protein ArdC